MTREEVVIDDGEDNDDLDWLKSPPKVPVNKDKLCENSIIKELRYNIYVKFVRFFAGCMVRNTFYFQLSMDHVLLFFEFMNLLMKCLFSDFKIILIQMHI